MYRHAGKFFGAAMEASRLRPDWQWVVAVCGQPEDEIPRRREGNLIVTGWAPQLALLERAAVMVTHGGISTITECIHFGTPMVIVPGGRDQPGNMARAVYHGIALEARMASITAQELASKAARAMSSPELRAALARMKARIDAENGLLAAVERIEAAAHTRVPEAGR
jgi:UDP:flavonoid glycosyltransferase YjiC (YdhE family)